MSECDRQTDGQTDGYGALAKSRFSIGERDKSMKISQNSSTGDGSVSLEINSDPDQINQIP